MLLVYFFIFRYFEYCHFCEEGACVETRLLVSLTSPVCMLSCFQLYPTLCDPMDCSLPGSYVHGIFQARLLEWVAMSPGNLPDPGIKPMSPALVGGFFTTGPPGKPR